MKKKVQHLDFTEVASGLSDAVVVTDTEGRITWCNKAFFELCGYTQAEVLGQKPGSFLQGPETNPRTVDAMRSALNKGQALHSDILNYHKDGSPYWVSVAISPLRTKKGELSGFVAIERDTTAIHGQIDAMEQQVVELYTTLLMVEEKSFDLIFDRDPFLSTRRHSSWEKVKAARKLERS